MKNKTQSMFNTMKGKFKHNVKSVNQDSNKNIETMNMTDKRRSRGLATKIIITVTALLVIALPVMVAITLLELKEISNEKQEISARDIGHQYSNSFKLMETKEIAAINGFASTVQLMQSEKITREQLILHLQSVMESQEKLNYIYIMFGPNQYDNNDEEFKRSYLYGGYENAGQFGLSISKLEQSFINTPLTNFDFYKETVQLPIIHRSEPINLGSETNPILYITLNVPIHNKQDEFIGAIGILMPLSDLQTLTEEFTTDTSSIALLSEKGTYVTHYDTARLNTVFEYKDDWARIQSGELTEVERQINGDFYLVQYIDLPLGESDKKWTIEISTKLSAIESEFIKARNSTIIICIIILVVVSAIIIIALRRWVFNPIAAINKHLKYIADGNLTKRLVFKSKDEFSEIAESYNQASESLRQVLTTVSELTLNVSATSEQMTASAQHTAKASENITLAIETVSQSADTQYKEIKQSNEQVNEMMEGITRISDSVATASESASKAEQQTVSGQVKMKETIEQMENVQTSVTKSNEAMMILTEKANEINKIVVLIETLSKQTNLLALNAAIEASRAGEAGRGFNVVASEIRHLAEQTKTATNQINQLIEVVQANISNASKSMLVGAQDVMKTVATVNETGQLFAVIRDEVEHVHTQITEVSAAAEQLQASSTNVIDATSNVANISQNTMSHANEVAAASEEQLATMQEMATSAEALSEMVVELTEKVSKFKI